jgi:hypothetical protein
VEGTDLDKRKKVMMAVLCGSVLIGGALLAGFGGKGFQKAEGVFSSTAPAVVSVPDDTGASPAATVKITAAASPADAGKPSPNSPEELSALSSMELAAENERLMLYVRKDTAEIAVKDKRDGYVWFSNPVGREKDPIASPLYKSELSSQVQLTYYNDKGQSYNFNSAGDSVNKKQFEVGVTDKGVKIIYRFGNVSAGADNIPAVISKERFETKILNSLKDENDRKQVTYKYRFNKEKQVYEIRKLADNVAAELAGLLEKAGYTKEDALEDNKVNGTVQTIAEDQAQFTIPVEYTLDGENLVANIPAKEVKYSPAFPLASVQLLKYFGAADGSKEGYMFVPDGSGALIRLNNRKLSAEPYNLPVYGEDGSFDVKERILTNKATRLPVFGIKQNDHAMLGIIEGGDALASVSADIGGRYHSYNSINSRFRFVAMDFYTLTSGDKSSSVPMFQKQTYQGDLRVRYAFLTGSSAEYAGMAAEYRSYLIGKYNLAKLKTSSDTPFVLELVGAFRDRKSFIGIPYDSMESLTAYDEAVRLLSKLKEMDIGNIALRYVGWFNGGIRHDSPRNISLASALGGKQKFGELMDYAKRNGVGLYPDAAFLEKYEGSSGSSYFLDQRKAAIYEYDPVLFLKDSSLFSHYVLSTANLAGTVDGFLSDYAKFGIDGLSLRDLGDEVNSDFNPQRPINRQDALQTIVAEAGKLKKQAGSLMVNGGNAYLLPFADMIVNAPTGSSKLQITDEEVPFYQIVLHGYVDMAGSPFNMDESLSSRASMLNALETGSDVYYQWFYGPASTVKDTRYNGLYALHYEDWLDEAVSLYREANPFLKEVRGQTIIGHQKLAEGVLETTFENGKSVIVNYNRTAVQVNDMTIEAESFRIGGD